MRMYHWGRGLELRLAREEIGLSMDELADELRVSRRTVQRWEGDLDPIAETLWDEVSKITEKYDARLAAAVDEIRRAAHDAGYPAFLPVHARHMRDRLAAVEAQEWLRKNERTTRLVSAAGYAAIEQYGYEDPLDP